MNKILYGKNEQERIVAIEVENNEAVLFMEDKTGSVSSLSVPNIFWILSPTNIDGAFNRLEGDLYYKWGRQFSERSDYTRMRHVWRNLNTFDIYNHQEALMVKDGYTYFKGMKHNEVSILSFDIETTGVTHDDSSFVVLISNTFRSISGEITKKLFSYDEYRSDKEMIKAWCEWVNEINPSIICGHNIFGFDLPYLDHCSKGGLRMGRDGSAVKFDQHESKFRKDGSQFIHYFKAKCFGRTFVDTMFLAIKYDVGRKYESYGLKSIIKQENLENPNRVFYDASRIRFTYEDPEEMKLIKAYAIDDADDALKLYDLMIAPFFYMAQSIPKSFQEIMLGATGSQINSIMMRAYLQDGHSLPKADEANSYQGAISIGNQGMYKNVHKVDVASLYPSIMIQYEVYDDDKDPRAYFAEMVKTFTNLRLEYKKKAKEDKYYDDLQGAYKIFINSCYGFLGTNGLLFNSPQGAEYITMIGRMVLQKSIEWAKYNGYHIVNADTDSISYCHLTSDELLSEEKRKANLVDLNSLFPEKIKFEDDGFFKKVIILAAKNYVLQTSDGKVKLKGSALKDAKKEKALKNFQKEVIDCLLDDKPAKNIIDIYHKYVIEIKQGISHIKDWCSKKTLTEKVFNSPRANETKVLAAIENTEYKEADKIWVYFAEDNSLKLMEHYNNDYNREKLYEKLYKATDIFSEVLDPKIFVNYKLKKNQNLLASVEDIC